ncbi:MAG: ImmA/IrrE family metallo-endopeptidase [Desulfovibrio sp.]|jgi:Zn-dependent peptidase ImmA (M78 family)|nr:ImmA/IrrE family metallo-endopeptidase [Desulfovibrio sp.]
MGTQPNRLKLGGSRIACKNHPAKSDQKPPEISPARRLEAWENGEVIPTYNQLELLANAYRRPAITFLLPYIPKQSVQYADFCTVSENKHAHHSPEFAAFLRQVTILQRELIPLVQEELSNPLPYVGSVKINTFELSNFTIKNIADNIRNILDISFEQQLKAHDPPELLRMLRERAESVGIFTLVAGDLGTHHTKISPEEFRGIALVNPFAPVIVVNPYDNKSARVFTFVHELVHIWLGDGGISNVNEIDIFGQVNETEIFCNKVAVEFLMPEKYIESMWQNQGQLTNYCK